MDKQDTSIAKQPIQYKKGDKYIVPSEGSLGLLALGYQGLLAWRKAQEEAKTSEQAKDTTEAKTIELPVSTDE